MKCLKCNNEMNYHPFRGYLCFNINCISDKPRMKGYPSLQSSTQDKCSVCQGYHSNLPCPKTQIE